MRLNAECYADTGNGCDMRSKHNRYGSSHSYRALMDVLGLMVPGDDFFLMGSGANSRAYQIYRSRGIDGLAAFNRCVAFCVSQVEKPPS